MQVRATIGDPDDPGSPTYINTVTHWWDGSQIYGSSEEKCRRLRTGEDGKMIVEDGFLPNESDPALDGIDATGFCDNYWIGLSLLHTLFVKEHNAICDYLKGHYPTWDDERLFLIARLVNSALMAKIHTVEWTPGILATPVLKPAMNANWYGALPHWAKKPAAARRRARGHVRRRRRRAGAPRRAVLDHRGVRLRLPAAPADPRRVRAALAPHRRADRRARSSTTSRAATRATSARVRLVGHPLLVRRRQPRRDHAAQPPARAPEPDPVNGDRVDIGTIDILRDRERGVPRYNDFREKLRRGRVKKFEDLSTNKKWVERDPRGLRGRHRRHRPPGRACSPRSRRRASASATRRSGSSS